MTTKFTALPAWSKPTYTPSLLNLFERVALCGLEGEWIRLDAKTQRETMGFPVFGKQEFKILDGEIYIRRTSCFGQMFETNIYEANRVALALLSCKKLSPGVSGPGYL